MSEAQSTAQVEQPFIQHLLELRDRLLRAVVVVLILFLALFPFANQIYVAVAEPLMAHLPEGTSMIATGVASPFLTPFKLSLVAAVFLAMPMILYQAWAFIAPGLYKHEKQLALPLLVSSIILFYLGMLFAYFVVFPLVFAFLTSAAPEGVEVMTDIAAYLDFVLTLFFAFGAAFEVPVATILLVLAGITTPESLSTKRPYIIVGAFVIGMLLTPPDVISQTLLALPMWVLFEFGLIFSRVAVRARKRREETEEDGDESDTLPAVATATAGSAAAAEPAEQAARPEVGDKDYEPKYDFKPEDFRPLTEEEMDAELDRIEAAEDDDEEGHDEPESADADEPAAGEPDQPSNDQPADEDAEARRKRVDALLLKVVRLREQDDLKGARELLYQVLVSGTEDQIVVARNILDQLDLD